jgi:hypothetical protein
MDTDELRGRYSPMEMTIFETLRKQESATTDSLLRKVYKRKDDEPFNAGIVINRAVITLGQKLKRNREAFRLERRRKPRQRLIETRLVPTTHNSSSRVKETAV